MLSRVAEQLYWMARYIERAENTARLINVTSLLNLDLPGKVKPGWNAIIQITGSHEFYSTLYDKAGDTQVMRFLIGDMRNPSSILSCLQGARENLRTLREIVPREAWEKINDMSLFAKNNLQKGLSKRGSFDYLREIILGAQTITGMLAGTMNHDDAYEFIRIGRNLERADMTTRILDVRSAMILPDASDLTPFENIQWMSVLKSLTGYQMYRREMQVRVRRGHVLRFLFGSAKFPRAVYHTMDTVEACLRNLVNNEAPLRIVGRIKRQLMDADYEKFTQEYLHQFVDDLQAVLIQLHEQIAITYFQLQEPGQTQQQAGVS